MGALYVKKESILRTRSAIAFVWSVYSLPYDTQPVLRWTTTTFSETWASFYDNSMAAMALT
jgi:hypothetical protein